jgi:predicted GNAT family N-acyltransferase
MPILLDRATKHVFHVPGGLGYIELVAHNSPAYWQSVQLRHRVLREPLGMMFTREELLGEHGQYHFVGRDPKGQLVAVLVLKGLKNNKIKMRQVAVDFLHQGQGWGKQLVAICEQFARDKGFRAITLHARREAMAFYGHLQYTVKGDVFEEVGIPHYKMVKSL